MSRLRAVIRRVLGRERRLSWSSRPRTNRRRPSTSR